MDVRIRVVAVIAANRIRQVTISVCVIVKGAIAVGVHAVVPDLCGPWMDVGIEIITVVTPESIGVVAIAVYVVV